MTDIEIIATAAFILTVFAAKVWFFTKVEGV